MLQTERLVLLPPSMDQQPQMLEAIIESQAELGLFLPWVPFALTEEASIENTRQAITNFEQFEGELRFSIMEQATGTLVGAVGLMIIDKAIPYFEIGYWLRTCSVGQGYMTEAVRAIENYAFTVLHAKRVEIKAASENVKSYSVAERCGYLYEGKLMNHRLLPSGEIGHTVVYAKTSL